MSHPAFFDALETIKIVDPLSEVLAPISKSKMESRYAR